MSKRKSKMGRPPKVKALLQSARFMVNATRAEKALLDKDARAAGTRSVSTYLLDLWRRHRETGTE